MQHSKSATLFKRCLHGAIAIAMALTLCTAFGQQGDDIDTTLAGLRKQIDTAQTALKNSDTISDDDLQQLRDTVLSAQSQADAIATQLAPQLASVQDRITQLGTQAAGTKEDASIATQRSLLAKNSSELDAQVKLARLLSVEGGQVAEQTRVARRAQFQARLGERTHSILGAPFWSELRDDLPRDSQRLADLGRQLATAARATPLLAWLTAPFLLAAGWWLLGWGEQRVMQWLTTRAPAGRLRRSLYALLVVLRWTAAFGVLAVVLHTGFDWKRTLPDETEALLDNLAGFLWFAGFVMGLTSALISARRPSWRLSPMPDAVASTLRWFPAQITAVMIAAWLAERLTALVNASLSMTVAINCVVALAMGLAIGLALMRAERMWRIELAKEGAHTRPLWHAIAAGLNWWVLTGAVVCLLSGYVAFGSFAIKQVVWALIVLGATYLLTALIDDALMTWLGAARPPDDKAHGTAPSLASKAPAQLAVVASGLLRLAVLLIALMLLAAPFGEGPADLLRRSGHWQDGVSVGEVKLLPGAILQALLVLVASLTAMRLLRRWLADRYLPTTSLDPGMRSSATSLFSYAGVVVAVSLALSAVGIGLERIAWVASALSVGIGFGLQAVVQNFVSGLILLAEQPVKVGDWVSLGGVEGDIRRINVRATEIQMGDRSTVIVPNSEFITKVVRNVTLANPLGLVQLKLPVPLGSDPQQVREMLLQAFADNDDVLAEPAPGVLLDGVDNGTLMFNATGFVNSPRMAGNVRSALLFDMLGRLSAAGITLARPPTMLINAPSAPAPASPSPIPGMPGTT